MLNVRKRAADGEIEVRWKFKQPDEDMGSTEPSESSVMINEDPENEGEVVLQGYSGCCLAQFSVRLAPVCIYIRVQSVRV